MLRLQSTVGYLGSLPELFSTSSWKKQPKQHGLKNAIPMKLIQES